MAIHRGAYVRQLIVESEMTVTEIAERLSVGRNTLYRWMENENLPLTKMVKLARVLGVDISGDFPKVERMNLMESEGRVEDDSSIKSKYLSLLEKHAQLLEELSELKEEIAKYKKS